MRALVPRSSAQRLSLYLREARRLVQRGVKTVSSRALGEPLGVPADQVRKDLGHLGPSGRPGVGYEVAALVGRIRALLGLDRTWKVVVAGGGNLGRALTSFRGFEEQGFRIVGLFDNDPAKRGQRHGTLVVQPPDRLAEVVREEGVELGVITVPADAAQEVANLLVQAGVRGILNFAPIPITVPPGVVLQAVDLSTQLEQITYQLVSKTR